MEFIYLLGGMMPLLAVDFSIGGSLRGAGDTRFPLMATMFSLIGMRCGLAALATYLGLPVVWVYAALVGDYLVKASMLIWRFQRGRWKTIVPTEDLGLKPVPELPDLTVYLEHIERRVWASDCSQSGWPVRFCCARWNRR